MAIAMVVGATAFGVTAAIAVFVRPAPAATPAALAAQTPGAATNPSAPATAATAQATGVPTDTTTPPDTSAAPGSTKPGGGGAVSAKAAPAATSAGAVGGKGPLDLGGLGGNVRPSTDDTNDGPKAAGQCFSSGQVSQVIGLHQPGIRRACWERNPTTKPTVNVNVSLNIGPDGAPQSVSANADEPSIAKCVENDVRTWRFPAMGCSQQTGFSFHFVRQRAFAGLRLAALRTPTLRTPTAAERRRAPPQAMEEPGVRPASPARCYLRYRVGQ